MRGDIDRVCMRASETRRQSTGTEKWRQGSVGRDGCRRSVVLHEQPRGLHVSLIQGIPSYLYHHH